LSSDVDTVAPSRMLSSVELAKSATFSLIFGDVNVLFVRVCVLVVPTTAPVAPWASVRFACVVTYPEAVDSAADWADALHLMHQTHLT
jgi:hypothetical protein